MRGRLWRKAPQIGWFMGVLLLLGALSGCSLFLPEGIKDLANSDELGSSSGWLVAAQGQGGPPGCVQELSPGQAKKLATRLLGSKQGAKLLKQALERRGKRLQLGKAHGCRVKAHSQVAGQGLFALEETTAEATLIEVPAGTDAALYLLESPTGDGNEWVAMKETAADGERLIHLEVGIADDSDIQGLSEAEVGEMSLFLPDDAGIQEVATDVQQLLWGDSGTSGAAVQALEAGGYDWARAEVILDDSRVTISEDGSEELEAVLVVPEAGTSGEALWGRTGPMIDEDRALYATVKVKRTVSTSSTTRRMLKVTTPPAQVKWGSELKFEPFDLCPYRNYGRVAAFRKALCYRWERQAASKVQKVTFDRTVRNLPEIHSWMLTASRQSSKIMGVGGKDRGLLVYGKKNLGPEELLKLFDATASGAAALSAEGQVEGQQVYELLKIFLDFVRDLVQWWRQMSEEERDAFKRVLLSLLASENPEQAAQSYHVQWWQQMSEEERDAFKWALFSLLASENPEQAARSYYESAAYDSEEGRAFKKVVDGIARALQNYLGLSPDQALEEALRIMGIFVSTIKSREDPGLMTAIVEQAGAAGIIAFTKLVEAQQYANANYVFPKDIVGFFGKVLQLKKILTAGWSLFLEHLAAAAAQAASKAGTSEGEAALEIVARLTLLQDLFSKMHQKGWGWLEYGFRRAGWAGHPFLDFYGKKPFDVSGIGDYLWHIVGWVEPYLSQGDVDRILQQIENAANWILQSISLDPFGWGPFFGGGKQAIVQVIDNYDSRALADLCSCVSSRYYGVPVVIIVDGQVACHSQDVSDQGAQDICNEMGLCSSSSGNSEDGDPPPGTYSVPMGDPYTGQCPPGYSFCMI